MCRSNLKPPPPTQNNNDRGKLEIISENTPPSIAAGSIYMAACYLGIFLPKSKIAEVSLTSEVTITKSYKKLTKYQDQLIE